MTEAARKLNELREEALAAATEGDLGPLTTLLDAISAPYDASVTACVTVSRLRPS